MIKLTVYFEDPFWTGIFEKTENNSLSVVKVVFGSEPKDGEIYQFILSDFQNLVFGAKVPLNKKISLKKPNPKRIHRKIRAELKKKTISTKAQTAVALDREARKSDHKTKKSLRKKEEKQEEYLKKRKKAKSKKRH